MAYQMVATAVTLNDTEGHLPVADVFTCNPSNICAAFYTISTDIVLAWFLWISKASCQQLSQKTAIIFELTSRVARFLCNSRASCFILLCIFVNTSCSLGFICILDAVTDAVDAIGWLRHCSNVVFGPWFLLCFICLVSTCVCRVLYLLSCIRTFYREKQQTRNCCKLAIHNFVFS